MKVQNIKDYAVLIVVSVLFLIMIPKVCAQTTEISLPPKQAKDMRTKLVEYSKDFLGCPYEMGAVGPDTFDCSGFVYTMFRESVGIQLPRKAENIFAKSEKIEDSEIEVGDLVFFKTTDSGNISHVGIYTGENYFIHCASDGAETGVIISTLERGYWNKNYAGAGRYIPSGKAEKNVAQKLFNDSEKKSDSKDKAKSEKTKVASKTNSTSNKSNSDKNNSDKFNSFMKNVVFDATVSADWNLFDTTSFKLNFRGLDAMFHARYETANLKPGIGTYIRYDYGTDNFQLPIVASLTFGEYVRVFTGPVIPIGKANLPGDKDVEIKNSIFPGIIGVCWNSPSLKAGKFDISFSQDVHYTVFNKTDGTALTPFKSFASGLVFASGVRVTLPMRNVL